MRQVKPNVATGADNVPGRSWRRSAGCSTCSSFRTVMSRNWSIGGRSRWCPRCSKFPRCVSGSFWTKSCKVCRISCSVSVRIDGVWTSSHSVCGRPWSGQRSSSSWKGVCCRRASVFAGHGARESRHARAAPLQHQSLRSCANDAWYEQGWSSHHCRLELDHGAVPDEVAEIVARSRAGRCLGARAQRVFNLDLC